MGRFPTSSSLWRSAKGSRSTSIVPQRLARSADRSVARISTSLDSRPLLALTSPSGMNRKHVLVWCSGLVLLAACTHTAAKTTASTPPAKFACPSDANLGVYQSNRLNTLKECAWFAGTVATVDTRSDGDLHMLLAPDQGYAQFLNAGNQQAGGMVVEIMPGQTLPAPSVGEHIQVFGTWVLDTNNGWNEIHPVWGIKYLDTGSSAYSLPPVTPQYSGGSNS